MKQNEYLEKFMAQFPFEGLTYDDVSLVLQYADFLPDSTDLSTRLTSRIRINIPFLSAAMDTVTEAPMAAASTRRAPSTPARRSTRSSPSASGSATSSPASRSSTTPAASSASSPPRTSTTPRTPP